MEVSDGPGSPLPVGGGFSLVPNNVCVPNITELPYLMQMMELLQLSVMDHQGWLMLCLQLLSMFAADRGQDVLTGQALDDCWLVWVLQIHVGSTATIISLALG